MDGKKAKLRENPEPRATFLSRILFCYMHPIFYRGFRKQLLVEDMYEPLKEHESQHVTNDLKEAWQKEQKIAKEMNRAPSLVRAVARIYGFGVMGYGSLLFLEEVVKLAQPVFMGMLIRYFRFDAPLSLHEAYFAAGGVAICAALVPLIHHPYFYGLQKYGMRIKIGCGGMIMDKAVHLSSGALHKTTVGHIVNLMSNDLAKLDFAFIFFHYTWVSPLMLIGYTAMLWKEIGVSCLAGFGAIVVLIPIQGYFSRQMGKCRRKIAVRTDKRMSVMNEILNGIRVIKMYAWEGAFAQLISELRAREIAKVKQVAIWQALVMGTFWASGKLVILFAVLCFIFTGNELTAERVFVAAALYNACRLPITLFLPFAIQFIFEGKVSLNRVQKFLELEDFSSNVEAIENGNTNGASKEPNKTTADYTDDGPIVELRNFSAKWDGSAEDGDVEQGATIQNLNLTARPGQLIAIIGPVGSGKSTLLASILGETRKVAGKLIRRGTVAYAAQEAWIFSASIRQNILFGLPHDSNTYNKTVHVCALRKDFERSADGDQALVGDRGVALSGGQKARVNLARAVYRDADIYLLDDPLSAVDAAVGRYLFDKCITDHLRKKITILVTHQLQYLQRADRILLMKGGKVVAEGTYPELMALGHTFTDILNETEQSYSRQLSTDSAGRSGSPKKILHEMEREANSDDDSEEDRLLSTANDSQLERSGASSAAILSQSLSESAWSLAMGKGETVITPEEEDRLGGSVSWSVYGHYLAAMANPLCCVFWLFGYFILVQAVYNFSDWWLNLWTDAAERERYLKKNVSAASNETLKDQEPIFKNVSLDDYMWVYIWMVLALMVMAVTRVVWFRLAQTAASRRLHNRMFNAVVKTSISFFDKNPIGRILNRFSKDVGAMDEQLAFVFFDFLTGTLNFLGMVAVIVAINPLIFAPTLPLVLLFFFLRYYYLQTSRDIKRLESTTRSPVFSHISAVLNGLTTVRAFGSEKNVLETYHNCQNINTSAFHLTVTTSRWFAGMIDWLVTVFIAIVAFFCVWTGQGLVAAEVGLIMMYALTFTRVFARHLEMWTRVEVEMVSVERVISYSQLEPEADLQSTDDRRPPADWPTMGHLAFCNVSLRYDADQAAVLDQITFDVRPKEKIGIVGRTGAGKSSLLRALFRLTEPEGKIMIDDIDTKTIGLHDLRKRLSIIPQDPVLFIGTLRKNLDPFTEFTDEQLWSALEQVELKAAVSELPFLLETHMQEGGANFSVGQRQLVCLARALLRNSRILVIDEATANVDPETDSLIQETIKSRFVDSTVLTIAHRLNTIMDSDRVMVLENGHLMEFDHPHVLLQNENSLFAGLVAETGKSNTHFLKRMAAQTYEGRKDK